MGTHGHFVTRAWARGHFVTRASTWRQQDALSQESPSKALPTFAEVFKYGWRVATTKLEKLYDKVP